MTAYIAPWRRQLLAGKFRDVAFFVKNVQTQVGRRVAMHEYPQRDDAYPEDLGQKADAFTIEALVIGPDYFKARDALIAALKKRGPGTLIHPYYGQRTVILASPARIAESPEEGGMARFSLDFIEAGENVEPAARQDSQAAVESAADTALEAIAGEYAGEFSLDGVPEFVESAALELARDAMRALEAARRSLVPDLSILTDYMAAADALAGSLGSLIRAPGGYAQSVIGMIGALKGLARSPAGALTSYRGLFGYGDSQPVVRTTTPARVRQAANQSALTGLTRRAALVEAGRVASRVEIATYDEAVALRDDLAERLDDEAAGTLVSEPVYQALTALRVALVRDLTARAITAPRVSRVTLPSTLPALVAAYRIHGDATRADELVARNGRLVRHPGFVPGGEPLEVLA